MSRLLLVLAVALSLTGCFHIRYTNDGTPTADPAQKNWHHNVVFGLVEVSDPENVSKACPEGFALAKSEQSFVAGLVQALTLGIYNPTDVAIFCTAKK
jgi:hypothetical protein